MSKKVTTAKELGAAIKDQEDIIIIEGDLVNGVIRIKATGKIAWALCVGSLGTAAALWATAPAHVAVTGGVSATITFGAAIPAAATLGLSATTAAVSIAVAAGGVGALNKLRSYKITKHEGNMLILERK